LNEVIDGEMWKLWKILLTLIEGTYGLVFHTDYLVVIQTLESIHENHIAAAAQPDETA
jgi:hypothetical protein